MKDKYKQIINHYGIKSQHKYWYSEIQELSESITEYEIFKKSGKEDNEYEEYLIKHIAEEISDNLMFLFQFVEFYSIDKEIIKGFLEYKADRQLKRIQDELNKQ